ncbi:hypothetical protein [Muricoccus radiodurans]|uniref:hypothetical protein n=1 Tax=Muricoccus radiodurans TaxID=2231721 RepID=UPI003CF35198
MRTFWTLLGLDVVVAVAAMALVSDLLSIPAAAPMGRTAYAILIAALCAVPVAALILKGEGRRRLAIGLLLLPTVPAALGALAMASVTILVTADLPGLR